MAQYVPTLSCPTRDNENNHTAYHARPWIADLVIQGLKVYLSPDYETLTEAQLNSLPFSLWNDNSNLSIIVKSTQKNRLVVLKWEPSNTGKTVKAYVTDGHCGIWATFVQTALDSELPPKTSITTLKPGAVLSLKNFEIRLADHVNPPKVVLHLVQFRLNEGPTVPSTSNPPTLYDNKTATKYLHSWKRQEEIWRMAPYPNSPLGLRSQVGDEDSDVETHDPDSVSQAQFATQIPVRETPKRPKPDKQPSSHHNKSIKSQLIDQLAPKETRIPPPELTASAKVTEPSLRDDVTPTASELSQRQIVPPSSDFPSTKANDGGPDNEAESAASREEQNDTFGEAMPSVIVNMLKALRKECHDGRYVPRRLHVIPKDQLELLESDDRWQPPLVGRSQRPGTVPLDLLNELSRRADLQSSLAVVNSQEVGIAEKTTEGRVNNRPVREESPGPSNNSSESSERVSWTPSPVRIPDRKRLLPPDSPPTLSDDNVVEFPSKSVQSVEKQVDQYVSATSLRHATTAASGEAGKNIHVSIESMQDHLQGTKSLPIAQSNNAHDEVSLPHPSTLPSESESLFRNVQTTVQVKRTPLPMKEIVFHKNIPDSSANIIPGTYDERPTMQHDPVEQSETSAARKQREASGAYDGNFEADSSEDQADAERVRNYEGRSRLLPPKQKNGAPKLSIPSSTSKSSKAYSEETKVDNLKRRIEVDQPRPLKRFKDGAHKTTTLEVAQDSDYRSIDEERTFYRRQMLSKIARIQGLVGSTISPMTQSDSSRNIHRQFSVQEKQALKNYSPSTSTENVDIPDTHQLLHRSASRSKAFQTIAGSFSAVSDTSDVPLDDLYAKFKSTYPAYGGQMKHFRAACILLKELQMQGRATHPSLWDDFVFRHHHDYLEHLQDVIENYGSALPYEKFYEECVEQPTYLHRVIKLSYLNGVQLRAGSSRLRTSSVDVALQTDIPLAANTSIFSGVDRSGAADNSTSDVVITQKPADQAPQNQNLIDQPHKSSKASKLHQEVDEAIPQYRNPSQSSRTSVNLWLEKAAGAESPILGTPEVTLKQNSDVPTIDRPREAYKSHSPHRSVKLQVVQGLSRQVQDAIALPNDLSDTTNSKKRNPRTLPWAKNPATYSPAPLPNPPTPKSKSSPHNRSSLLNNHANLDTRLPKAPNPILSLSSTLSSSAPPKPKTTLPRTDPTTAPPPPSKSVRNKSELRPWDPPKTETAFTRFARLYNEIPSEKVAVRTRDASNGDRNDDDAGTKRMIDIFTWRK